MNCWGMNAYSSERTISSALEMAPVIPSLPGVRTTSAPKAAMRRRRSTLIVSGMVMTRRYPLAAQTIERPMPVLPEVGSTTYIPGRRWPSRSAASIMDRATRSFTECMGLKDSSLA